MPAGAKPGQRRGGRKAGVPNKASQARQKVVAVTGVTPLDIMLYNARAFHAEGLALTKKLARMQDANPLKTSLLQQRKAARDAAEVSAKHAAEYIHPKLQSVMHATDPDNVTKVVHSVDNDTLARMAQFIRGGVPKQGG